mmetsp:Transcript_23113/g.66235  ORF Transcript_23113/g.66235 Transcript_23113/m.66235 type:complete len:97 (+) Transcript_23113:739-1029(+)
MLVLVVAVAVAVGALACAAPLGAQRERVVDHLPSCPRLQELATEEQCHPMAHPYPHPSAATWAASTPEWVAEAGATKGQKRHRQELHQQQQQEAGG